MSNANHPIRRILSWRGVFTEADRPTRLKIFAILTLVSVALIFVQLGFIGIGPEDEYVGYALALIAPIAATALVLGKLYGFLEGLISGAVLLVHAHVQPLDIFEHYLVTPLNSVVLYGFFGLFTGLCLSVALRNDPQGTRRKVYLVVVSLLTTIVTSVAFISNAFLDIVMATAANINQESEMAEALGGATTDAAADIGSLIPSDVMAALLGTGSPAVQVIADFLLVLAVFAITESLLRHYRRLHGHASLRVSFRERLIATLFLTFSVVASAGYTAITVSSRAAAQLEMQGEIDFIITQVKIRMQDIVTYEERELRENELLADLQADGSTDQGSKTTLDGYDLYLDGTIVVFKDRGDGVAEIILSDNPAYPAGLTQLDVFSPREANILKDLAESRGMQWMIYTTKPHGQAGSDASTVELGHMVVESYEDYYVMMARPSSMVYETRSLTVTWTVIVVFALFAVAFIAATRLLTVIVVNPIDTTNASLAKITSGDLDEVVDVRKNTEFDELSDGINSTVDSLKRLIDEAERRNEQDLITARRIQEGALPQQFPAFPDVGDVNLFASMDAAKEVGGDFYDFFEIDDRTLAFLIADVSGKGIPGALFMMAAKNEIRNRILAGTSLAETIATANAHLCANNEAGMFVTVWAATIDWRTGRLTYVNAGHNFPLLRRGRGGDWEWLSKKCGLFLGTFETARYRQEELVLEPGDELVLYTDGVNEAFDVHEREYGNERLEAFLAAHADLRPDELVPALRADVAAWAEGAEQSDDVTIMAVEYACPNS